MSEERKITGVVLDPKWTVGTIDIDGHKYPLLTFHGPHGPPCDILIPVAEARTMGAYLQKVAKECSDDDPRGARESQDQAIP